MLLSFTVKNLYMASPVYRTQTGRNCFTRIALTNLQVTHHEYQALPCVLITSGSKRSRQVFRFSMLWGKNTFIFFSVMRTQLRMIMFSACTVFGLRYLAYYWSRQEIKLPIRLEKLANFCHLFDHWPILRWLVSVRYQLQANQLWSVGNYTSHVIIAKVGGYAAIGIPQGISICLHWIGGPCENFKNLPVHLVRPRSLKFCQPFWNPSCDSFSLCSFSFPIF